MSKTKLQIRISAIQAFCRESHPEAVTYRQVAYKFNLGYTLAAELCRTAADVSADYEYDHGELRFLGCVETEDIKTYFDEKESIEKELQKPENLIPPGEAWQLRNILEAKPLIEKDKAKVQWDPVRKKEWTPDDDENRTDSSEEYPV